jgi:hypothetical protein
MPSYAITNANIFRTLRHFLKRNGCKEKSVKMETGEDRNGKKRKIGKNGNLAWDGCVRLLVVGYSLLY